MSCWRCNDGVIVTCIDDICRGLGRCIHGDGERACPECDPDDFDEDYARYRDDCYESEWNTFGCLDPENCIMQGPHFPGECLTAEDAEAEYEEAAAEAATEGGEV